MPEQAEWERQRRSDPLRILLMMSNVLHALTRAVTIMAAALLVIALTDLLLALHWAGVL